MAVSSSDVVFYYKCDENASNTTVADAHGSNDATASVNTSSLYKSAGKINSCFESTGTTEYVDMTGADPGASTFTISMWINPDNLTRNQFMEWANPRLILDCENTAGNLRIYDGSYRDWTDATAVMATGWHHYMWAFDGTNNDVELFIDGDSKGTVTWSPRAPSSTATFLGNNAHNYWLDGAMDEIAVFDTLYGATEAGELYNSGNGLAYPFSSNVTVYPSTLSISDSTPVVNVRIVKAVNSLNLGVALQAPTLIGPTPKKMGIGTGGRGSKYIRTSWDNSGLSGTKIALEPQISYVSEDNSRGLNI